MEYSELRRCLRDARRSKGVLQEALAERLGISQGQLSRYETGEQPIPANMLTPWCDALGLRLAVTDEAAAS